MKKYKVFCKGDSTLLMTWNMLPPEFKTYFDDCDEKELPWYFIMNDEFWCLCAFSGTTEDQSFHNSWDAYLEDKNGNDSGVVVRISERTQKIHFGYYYPYDI